MNSTKDNKPDAEVTQEIIDRFLSERMSNDMKTSARAHLCLLALSEAAIPYLVEAMKSKHKRMRWEAAKTLAEMRNPAIAPILAQTLDNPDDDLRWLAAEGLIALGKKGLPDLLKALIKNPTSTWILQGAHHIIRDLYLGRAHPGEEKYMKIHSLDAGLREKIHVVLKALESPEASLQVPAASRTALHYLEQNQ
jgi:hypothetical protein